VPQVVALFWQSCLGLIVPAPSAHFEGTPIELQGLGPHLTLVTHVVTIPYDKKLEAQGSERAVSLGQ